MRKLAALLTIAAFAFHGFSATWYLDASASGSNNGTNWANAWTNVTNVVWGASGVKAGDTLSISSGTYTNSSLFVGASGTSSSWIRIEASREAGHNSTRPRLKSINLQGNQWIWIYGARDTNVALPNAGTIFTNQASLTNNIGLQFSHDDQGSDSQGIYMSGNAGANNWIEWCEFGPIGVNLNTNGWDANGIRMLNLSSNYNVRIRGCWFHDIRNDDINYNAATVNPTAYDSTIVESCWLQGGGDDAIQWTRNGGRKLKLPLSNARPPTTSKN